MISKDIQKQIRQLEISTKRLLRGSLIGQSSSAVKGAGLDFDQIRQYQPGDDVRFIDWKSSARSGSLMIKQYMQERSRNMMILVDLSTSSFFSSGKHIKYHIMREVAGALALVAGFAKDRVGLITFSDEILDVVPVNSGSKHIHMLLEKLFKVKKGRGRTSLRIALERVAQMRLKDALIFIISDFIDTAYTKPLAMVAKQYDVVAIRCLDAREHHMPRVGFLSAIDVETHEQAMIDMSSAKGLDHFLLQRLIEQNGIFKRYGIDLFEIHSGQPYIRDMIRFFKKRMLY